MDPIAILASIWRFVARAVTSKSAGPIGAILVVVLLGANLRSCAAIKSGEAAYLKLEAKEAREQVAAARTTADLTTCRANDAGLEASLNTQRNAVAELKARGDAATAAANRQVQAARAQAAMASATAARILARPVGDDVCKSALDLIRGG